MTGVTELTSVIWIFESTIVDLEFNCLVWSQTRNQRGATGQLLSLNFQ